MMQQYMRIKEQHSDSILFFRLGDFYEMFKDDAVEVSSLLNLTLTQRNGIKMCGIPYHASDNYISRLLQHGKKIAICEQIKLPEGNKGIAERQVVQIVTPGTVVNEDYLDRESNNYLVAIGKTSNNVSFSYVDLSTADFYTAAFPLSEKLERLRKELYRLGPKEILVQESFFEEDSEMRRLLQEGEGVLLNRYPDWIFDTKDGYRKLTKQFGVANLKGFGLEENSPEIPAAGVLLDYIEEASKSLLPHIRTLHIDRDYQYVMLDESTQRNLELVRNMQDGSRHYTLLSVIDHTKTAMGSRLLRKWLLQPLIKKESILERQNNVERLYRNQILLGEIRDYLRRILDIERLTSKVAMDKAHAKDLLAIRDSLFHIFYLSQTFKQWNEDNFKLFSNESSKTDLEKINELLKKAIREDPPVIITEGKLILEGYDKTLDEQRNIKKNSKEILENYLEEERKTSGIQRLRIKYNKIIGYFLEVTKGNIDKVPSHFMRKQSLVGSERYTTDKLLEIESNITSASDKIIEREKQLFLEVREYVKQKIPQLLDTAKCTAYIDCIQSFAQAATINGYTKPKLNTTGKLQIEKGRHPVVERNLPPGDFVPNDLDLLPEDKVFGLITGPNMAGKSTYLRQTALIVLLSQCGSFVPAQEAHIGIVDKVFCRVGASDNLARGESTFLVEMNETSNILRSATKDSLVIMDEVGRGTSTIDGLSIAWAVSEYLLNALKAKTLFATHYHELTTLEHNSIKNLSLEVTEREGEIIFVKKVREKPAAHSYGIHVAKLAGLPREITSRATEIQQQLVKNERTIQGMKESADYGPANQNSLFSEEELVIKELESLDVNAMTPLQALNKIAELKKSIKNGS